MSDKSYRPDQEKPGSTEASVPDVERAGDGETLATTRPTLLVATVRFHSDEREETRALDRTKLDSATRVLTSKLEPIGRTHPCASAIVAI